MRGSAWLAVAAVLIAAGCTFDSLSSAQAESKRRCLKAADSTAEASRESEDAYNAAEGMLEGVVPTRRHQSLYLDFVEADEHWRRTVADALAICSDAVADNSADSEVRQAHALLVEASEAAEVIPSFREGCRLAHELGDLPEWWQC